MAVHAAVKKSTTPDQPRQGPPTAAFRVAYTLRHAMQVFLSGCISPKASVQEPQGMQQATAGNPAQAGCPGARMPGTEGQSGYARHFSAVGQRSAALQRRQLGKGKLGTPRTSAGQHAGAARPPQCVDMTSLNQLREENTPRGVHRVCWVRCARTRSWGQLPPPASTAQQACRASYTAAHSVTVAVHTNTIAALWPRQPGPSWAGPLTAALACLGPPCRPWCVASAPPMQDRHLLV